VESAALNVHHHRNAAGLHFDLMPLPLSAVLCVPDLRLATDTALAVFVAPIARTLAYDRCECDIEAAMIDAGETLMAASNPHPKGLPIVAPLAIGQGRKQSPLCTISHMHLCK
jgi:hypothetical protein